MSENNNINMSEYKAFRVYHNEKGQAVYLPFFSKTGYILIAKDIKTFSLFSMRTPLAVVVGALVWNEEKIWVGIVAAIAVFLFGEVLMRIKFLSSLPPVPNFKKPSKEQEQKNFSKAYDNGKKETPEASIQYLLLMMAVGVALCYFTVSNAFKENYAGLVLYGNYLIALGAAGFSIYCIVEVFKKLLKKK